MTSLTFEYPAWAGLGRRLSLGCELSDADAPRLALARQEQLPGRLVKLYVCNNRQELRVVLRPEAQRGIPHGSTALQINPAHHTVSRLTTKPFSPSNKPPLGTNSPILPIPRQIRRRRIPLPAHPIHHPEPTHLITSPHPQRRHSPPSPFRPFPLPRPKPHNPFPPQPPRPHPPAHIPQITTTTAHPVSNPGNLPPQQPRLDRCRRPPQPRTPTQIRTPTQNLLHAPPRPRPRRSPLPLLLLPILCRPLPSGVVDSPPLDVPRRPRGLRGRGPGVFDAEVLALDSVWDKRQVGPPSSQLCIGCNASWKGVRERQKKKIKEGWVGVGWPGGKGAWGWSIEDMDNTREASGWGTGEKEGCCVCVRC